MNREKTSSSQLLKIVGGGKETSPRVSEKPSLFPYRTFHEDELIVDVGDPPDLCWIIVSGGVVLSVLDHETGDLHPSVKLGPGHLFGADMNGSCAPSLFQITTTEPSKIYEIRPEDLTSQGGDMPLIHSRLDHLKRARDATFPKLYQALKELTETGAYWGRVAHQHEHNLTLIDQQREEAERRGCMLNAELVEKEATLAEQQHALGQLQRNVNELQQENHLLARDNLARELVERGKALHRTERELAELTARVKDLQANAESAMNYVTELMKELVAAQHLQFESVDGEVGEELLGLLSNLFMRMLESDNPRTRKFAIDALGGLSKLPAIVAKRQLKP